MQLWRNQLNPENIAGVDIRKYPANVVCVIIILICGVFL